MFTYLDSQFSINTDLTVYSSDDDYATLQSMMNNIHL
jgi:hypothetical protein